jgi:hypothetical protein
MAPSDTIGGLDLMQSTRKYDFVVTNAPAGPFNHYTFFVCTRRLRIRASGIEFGSSR